MADPTSRTLAFWAFSLVVATVSLPYAAAQAPPYTYERVETCSQECLPPEANPGPLPRNGSQPVNVILYAHTESIVMRSPVNVQPPAPEEGYRNEIRSATLNTETGTPADVHFQNNEITWYSSAGPVFVVDGEWIVHQVPGFAEDVHIAGETIWLYLYLTATSLPGEDDGSGPLGSQTLDAMPDVGIYARIETGRFGYSKDSTLLAEADTGANDVLGIIPGSERAQMVAADSDGSAIWEFRIPLTVLNATWPSIWTKTPGGDPGPQGMIVTINVYQAKDKSEPADGHDTELMSPEWGVVSGTMPDGRVFPPRLVIPVSAPLVSKFAAPSLFENELFFRWSFVSAFGTVDINPQSLSWSLDGPTMVASEEIRPVILNFNSQYGGHLLPVNTTWRWNYREHEIADGDYEFRASIENWQGTYRLEERIAFAVRDGVPVTYSTDEGIVAIEVISDRTGRASEVPSLGLASFLACALGFGIRVRRSASSS